MISGTSAKLLTALSVCLLAAAFWVVFKFYSTENQQLSIKPERHYSDIVLEPLESNIGLQTRLPFQTIIAAAKTATVEVQTGSGEKQTCKRVLGAKVCATLQWRYKIFRDGEIEITSNNDRLELSLPIGFSGQVSVDGKGGKLLGLRNKDIDGRLKLIADLDINIGSDWCPSIDSAMSYLWLSDPRIRIIGDLRINLRKSVDKALQSKLAEVQRMLGKIVDCTKLREEISQHWHLHTVKLAMNADTPGWLHVLPISASASDVTIEEDHIRLSFELGASVELRNTDSLAANAPGPVTLPPLEPYTQTPGTVEFSLLLEVPYEQLTTTLSDKIVGKTFGDKNAVTITAIDVYPSGELLTMDIGLDAKAAGSLFTSTGNVYISAKPIADPLNNTLKLTELALTRTLDSRLITALSTVLRNQLLGALEKESLIDLGPSLEKVEHSIADALADPSRTAGIKVTADPPRVKLMALNPQSAGVAAIIHLSTRLDAIVPEDILLR